MAALRYWEQHSDRSIFTAVRFNFTDEQRTADIVIRSVERITDCGRESDEDAVGCAPLLDQDSREDRTIIRIETGYTDAARETIITHELGHVLGLSHGAPYRIMRPEQVLEQLPRTDAVEKSNPWGQSTIRVYVNYSKAPAGIVDDLQTNVDRAVGYYQDGGEGFTPDNVSIVMTDTEENADVVIEFDRRRNVGDRDDISNGRVYGNDTDADPRLEEYTNATIRHSYNTERDRRVVAYNIGLWMGYALGATDEYPPPWEREDITYEEDWWTRAEE